MYRPEYQLHRLRTMTTTTRMEGRRRAVIAFSLSWLRTMVVDLRWNPTLRLTEHCHHHQQQQQQKVAARVSGLEDPSHEGIAPQQHSSFESSEGRAPLHDLSFLLYEPMMDGRSLGNNSKVVVQHVTLCGTVSSFDTRVLEAEAQILSRYVQSLSCLTRLDVVKCSPASLISDEVLLSISAPERLQRLFLPTYCAVMQSSLERFRNLVELRVNGCSDFMSVAFCAKTLRVLYADGCVGLTDEGLREAASLEVLHVGSCRAVTDISACAHSLVELAATHSGITSAAIVAQCSRLQVLHSPFNVRANTPATSFSPSFASRLRELHADPSLTDGALCDVTYLVNLVTSMLGNVTTVAPFGATLRQLSIYNARVCSEGLTTATNLVHLTVGHAGKITTLEPFAKSLRTLEVMRGVNDALLAEAKQLNTLTVFDNAELTTVAPCGATLRHLVAERCRALTTEGLCGASQLVTLDCSGSSNVKAVPSTCANTLEELRAGGDTMRCVDFAGCESLRLVRLTFSSSIRPARDLVPLQFQERCDVVGDWQRETYAPSLD